MSMKKIIQDIRQWIFARIPLRDTIIFESCPVYTDNTKAVFEEMVRRELYKKYKFIWLHLGRDALPEGVDHVKFVKSPGKPEGDGGSCQQTAGTGEGRGYGQRHRSSDGFQPDERDFRYAFDSCEKGYT